jgi:hypothetical protein
MTVIQVFKFRIWKAQTRCSAEHETTLRMTIAVLHEKRKSACADVRGTISGREKARCITV